MKTLQEVLEYTPHTMPDPGGHWAGIGVSGHWMTVKNMHAATKTPVETTDTDAMPNIDLNKRDWLNAFFDVLGDIILHDHANYGNSPHDAGEVTTKDHTRIADVHSESVDDSLDESQMLDRAFSMIDEAVINQAGRLWEANVSFRGMSRILKVFYPTMRSVSRRTLQEDLNKVFSGAVVLTFSPAKDQGRISAPLVIMEDAYVVEDNVIFDAANNLVLVLEKKDKKVEKVMKEFKKGKLHSGSKDGPVVKDRKQAIAIALNSEGYVQEIFDNYVSKLAALEEDKKVAKDDPIDKEARLLRHGEGDAADNNADAERPVKVAAKDPIEKVAEYMTRGAN